MSRLPDWRAGWASTWLSRAAWVTRSELGDPDIGTGSGANSLRAGPPPLPHLLPHGGVTRGAFPDNEPMRTPDSLGDEGPCHTQSRLPQGNAASEWEDSLKPLRGEGPAILTDKRGLSHLLRIKPLPAGRALVRARPGTPASALPACSASAAAQGHPRHRWLTSLKLQLRLKAHLSPAAPGI